MGLDLVQYISNNVVGSYEITENLHKALFQNQNWRSYSYLRKISDYYKTDVMFSKKEIECFISDLESIKIFVSIEFHYEIDKLIKFISNSSVENLHIAGD